MSVTYSVNIGTQFETSRKDILSVLKDLPDNTHKLISPRDVRDAFLSTWANSPFKQTKTISGTEYIGLDSGNPADRDIKQKIFLGKRSFGNLDVLSNTLLNSTDSDIFIYNTKSDSSSQDSTKVSILAGTESSLYASAPYIESLYVSGKLNLNIVNPSLLQSPINIYSSNGRVAINGISFPTVAENSTGASNGKILRYVGTFPNGYLKWDDTNVTISQLGTPGTTTNIYGGTVSLNGYELEFVSNNLTPASVGGIPMGFSFPSTSFNGGKWPIVEVIRKLLYSKVSPKITIMATSSSGTKYAELGRTSSVYINWNTTIYPRNADDYISDYLITKSVNGATTSSSYYGLSFSGLPGASFSGSANGLVTGSYSLPTTEYYTFNATDIWKPTRVTYTSYPTGFSYSSTASLEFVYPIYYGIEVSPISNTSTSFDYVISNLSKHIAPYPGTGNSIKLNYSGTGYFYFIYQKSTFTTNPYKIIDPNGFVIYESGLSDNGTFDGYSTTGISNAGGSWVRTPPGKLGSTWIVWRSEYPISYTSTTDKFEFRF
jgi:hypothetical protein